MISKSGRNEGWSFSYGQLKVNGDLERIYEKIVYVRYNDCYGAKKTRSIFSQSVENLRAPIDAPAT